MARNAIIISNGEISSGSFGDGNKRKPRGNRKRRGIKRRYIALIYLCVISVIAMLIYYAAERRMRPIISSMAAANAKALAARVVSESVDQEIAGGNISYDNLITFEKNAAGNISALKTNIISVNKLKSRLSMLVLDKIAGMEYFNLKVPVGNLINGEFLSGRGPEIEIRLLPIGSVVTDITNIFSSAGINQTKHQIMLDVSVTISVIMPFGVETVSVTTSMCIAETIIVGDVPELYMESGANQKLTE